MRQARHLTLGCLAFFISVIIELIKPLDINIKMTCLEEIITKLNPRNINYQLFHTFPLDRYYYRPNYETTTEIFIIIYIKL